MKKLLIISILTAIILSATALSAGDSKTNDFTVTVICHDPIFIPTSNTLYPKPAIVAGTEQTFTSDNISSFYYEAAGNYTPHYTVTITRWDKTVTIGTVIYELDVEWSVSDDLHSGLLSPQPAGTGSTFQVDPFGDGCDAKSIITITAKKGRASAHSPENQFGVPFEYMMSAVAN